MNEDKYGGTIGILNIGSIEYLIYLLKKENDVYINASLALHNIIRDFLLFSGTIRKTAETAKGRREKQHPSAPLCVLCG